MIEFSVHWCLGAGLDSDSLAKHREPGRPNPHYNGPRRLRILIEKNGVELNKSDVFGVRLDLRRVLGGCGLVGFRSNFYLEILFLDDNILDV